jgi:glycosyltransferase involved in cell wall biosynthesis
MKILLATGIYPPEIGGPATFVYSLTRAWAAQGMAPQVVTYGDAQTETSSEFAVTVVSRRGGIFFRHMRYAWQVYRLARRVDIVFLQGAVSAGFPGLIAARLARVPTVMRIPGDYAWEMYTQQPTSPPELLDVFVTHRHHGRIRLLEWMERWSVRHVKALVTPSRYLKSIVTRWGAPERAISVIYNSISPLPETRSREELRRIFGCEEKIVVLTVVRAVPWKGVPFLVEVLATFPANVILVVVGDGPALQAWKHLAEDGGVADRCRFVGRLGREQVAEWYRAADVFALASQYEGFPHVVYEAVAAGLPCVVSEFGGNPETKEVFPGEVDVVPLADVASWARLLGRPKPRHAGRALRPFDEVACEIRHLLESVCAS